MEEPSASVASVAPEKALEAIAGGPLWPAESELLAAARNGVGATVSGSDNKVRAEVLAALCVDDGYGVDEPGVQLFGAVIEGQLNLGWARLSRPLFLGDCTIEKRMLLMGAHTKALGFVDCRFAGGLDGAWLTADGSVKLSGEAHEGIDLRRAEIGTVLDCEGLTVTAPKGGLGLFAAGIQTGSDVILDRCEVEGGTSFVTARIGGSATLRGSRFSNPAAEAITFDSAQIEGTLTATPLTRRDAAIRTRFEGMVTLTGGLTVGGNLSLNGASVTGAGGLAVVGDGARVGGTLALGQTFGYTGAAEVDDAGKPLRFEAEGSVRFRQARFEAIDASGGRFANRGGIALDLAGVRVEGATILSTSSGLTRPAPPEELLTRFEVEGAVHLTAVQLGGPLICIGARLANPGGVALSASYADIRGPINLRPALESDGRLRLKEGKPLRFESEGLVEFRVCKLAELSAQGAHLVNEGAAGVALSVYGTQIAGDLDITPAMAVAGEDGKPGVLPFEATGQVNCESASIGGRLLAGGARIRGEGVAAIHGFSLGVSAGIWLSPLLDQHRSVLTDGDGEPLRFVGHGGVSLTNSRLASFEATAAKLIAADGFALDLGNAEVAGTVAAGAVVASDGSRLGLPMEAEGGVNVSFARITGGLELRGARLGAEQGYSLFADRAKIAGTVLLDHAVDANGALGRDAEGEPLRFDSRGLAYLVRAELGELWCSGGLFRRAQQVSLDLTAATVAGNAYLGPAASAAGGQVEYQRLECEGRAALSGATVSGDLAMIGKFDGAEGAAIAADHLSVARSLNLGYFASALDEDEHPLRLCAHGIVDLRSAKVGHSLDLSGARVDNPGAEALLATAIEVGGDVLVQSPGAKAGEPEPIEFSSDGVVRFDVARIGGRLSCLSGRFENEHGDALSLQRAHVTGNIELAAAVDANRKPILHGSVPVRFRARGAVRLNGASTDADLTCRGGSFEGTMGVALDASAVTVGDNAYFDVMRRTDGEPLTDDEAVVPTFAALGEVRLRGMNVGGKLELRGARLENPGGLCFDGEGLRVARALDWREIKRQGDMSLRDASVETLRDDAASWGLDAANPPLLDLDGFTYNAVTTGSLTWQQRAAWLSRQRDYSTRPYRHLAELYRANGDDRSARKISMEQFDEQLRRPDVRTRRRERVGRKLLKRFIGHGYEPWRAIVPALLLWLIGTGAIYLAESDGAVIPAGGAGSSAESTQTTGTQPKPAEPDPLDCSQHDYPCLTPALFAADTILPIVDLGEADQWRITGSLAWRIVPPLLTIFGWALTTLLVAGVTGLVRSD